MRVLPQVDNNTLFLITWTGNKLNDAANKNPFMSDRSPSFQSDPIWGGNSSESEWKLCIMQYESNY